MCDIQPEFWVEGGAGRRPAMALVPFDAVFDAGAVRRKANHELDVVTMARAMKRYMETTMSATWTATSAFSGARGSRGRPRRRQLHAHM